MINRFTFIYRCCWQWNTKTIHFVNHLRFRFVSSLSHLHQRSLRISLRLWSLILSLFSCSSNLFSLFLLSCLFTCTSRLSLLFLLLRLSMCSSNSICLRFRLCFLLIRSMHLIFIRFRQISFIRIFNDRASHNLRSCNDRFDITHRRLHRLRIERIWLIKLRWS
jgi:hypothetical protein